MTRERRRKSDRYADLIHVIATASGVAECRRACEAFEADVRQRATRAALNGLARWAEKERDAWAKLEREARAAIPDGQIAGLRAVRAETYGMVAREARARGMKS